MSAGRRPTAGAVLLRAGRPADAAAVAAVMRAAVRGLPARACTPRQRKAWSSLPALYHEWAMGPGGERYLVAERDGAVVGYAAYRSAAGPRRARGRTARPPDAELTAVFVHPSAGRAGIGAALVRAVERRVRRRGTIRLAVVAARPAVGFYAALGFGAGRPVRAPLPGGARLPALRMRRRIARERVPPPRAGRRRAPASAR